jgi:PAS domain-containing protein
LAAARRDFGLLYKSRRDRFNDGGMREGYEMAPARGVEVAHAYAVRLMQHLVVPTFVIDPQRRVVIWNRACERLTGVAASEVLGTSLHWRAFYEKRRYCLADLVALGRQDKIGEHYPEHAVPEDNRLGSSAENWCVMPKLGNHLYLAIDAGPIHDEAGNLIAVVETLRDMTDQKRAEMAEDPGHQGRTDRPRQPARLR